MTKWLFESWILHFITCLRKGLGIDLTNRHLLILDGHNSHMTLEVVRIAMESRMNMISLPSHISHSLQPLDVACFKPFKTAFRKQRDSSTVLNKNKKVGKQDLCEWTSKALQIALTAKAGFKKTGIWLLDRTAIHAAMAPLVGFEDQDNGSREGGNNAMAAPGTDVGGAPLSKEGGGYLAGCDPQCGYKHVSRPWQGECSP